MRAYFPGASSPKQCAVRGVQRYAFRTSFHGPALSARVTRYVTGILGVRYALRDGPFNKLRYTSRRTPFGRVANRQLCGLSAPFGRLSRRRMPNRRQRTSPERVGILEQIGANGTTQPQSREPQPG